MYYITSTCNTVKREYVSLEKATRYLIEHTCSRTATLEELLTLSDDTGKLASVRLATICDFVWRAEAADENLRKFPLEMIWHSLGWQVRVAFAKREPADENLNCGRRWYHTPPFIPQGQPDACGGIMIRDEGGRLSDPTAFASPSVV